MQKSFNQLTGFALCLVLVVSCHNQAGRCLSSQSIQRLIDPNANGQGYAGGYLQIGLTKVGRSSLLAIEPASSRGYLAANDIICSFKLTRYQKRLILWTAKHCLPLVAVERIGVYVDFGQHGYKKVDLTIVPADDLSVLQQRISSLPVEFQQYLLGLGTNSYRSRLLVSMQKQSPQVNQDFVRETVALGHSLCDPSNVSAVAWGKERACFTHLDLLATEVQLGAKETLPMRPEEIEPNQWVDTQLFIQKLQWQEDFLSMFVEVDDCLAGRIDCPDVVAGHQKTLLALKYDLSQTLEKLGIIAGEQSSPTLARLEQRIQRYQSQAQEIWQHQLKSMQPQLLDIGINAQYSDVSSTSARYLEIRLSELLGGSGKKLLKRSYGLVLFSQQRYWHFAGGDSGAYLLYKGLPLATLSMVNADESSSASPWEPKISPQEKQKEEAEKNKEPKNPARQVQTRKSNRHATIQRCAPQK